MNQELMNMAKQAGLIGMRPHLDGIYIEALEAFAKLVAAAEREACAKLIEATSLNGLKDNPAMQSWIAEMLFAYVKAIRARGDTK